MDAMSMLMMVRFLSEPNFSNATTPTATGATSKTKMTANAMEPILAKLLSRSFE